MANTPQSLREIMVVLNEQAVGTAVSNIKYPFVVLAQDPPQGTSLPQGSTVTLTVVRADSIKAGVIKGVHKALLNRTVAEIAEEASKQPPSVIQTFGDVDDYTKLTEAQKVEINKALDVSVPNLDHTSAEDLNAAYTAVHGALALTGMI